MRFDIQYSSRALRFLESFNPQIRRRILEKVDELKNDPFPRGVMKIRGEENIYRLRVGDYRVLYEVFLKQGVILIVKIDHRSSVYAS